MMSAYTDEATIDRSRAAGAWLFLPKPVPLADPRRGLRVARQTTSRGAARRRRDEPDRQPGRGPHGGRTRGRREPLGGRGAVAPPTPADGGARLPTARRHRARGRAPAARPRSVDPDPVHFGVHGRSEGGGDRRDSARSTRWRSRSTRAASSPGSSSPSNVRRAARRPNRAVRALVRRGPRRRLPSPMANPSRAHRRCIRRFASRMSA